MNAGVAQITQQTAGLPRAVRGILDDGTGENTVLEIGICTTLGAYANAAHYTARSSIAPTGIDVHLAHHIANDHVLLSLCRNGASQLLSGVDSALYIEILHGAT